MPTPLIHDLTGKYFHNLQVLCRCKKEYKKETKWICLCKCGNVCYVYGQNLRNGKSRSCGCLRGQHMIKKAQDKESYV